MQNFLFFQTKALYDWRMKNIKLDLNIMIILNL